MERVRATILFHTDGALNGLDEITCDTPMLGIGLGLDSLDALALVTAIENEFDILVDDEELSLDLFETVGTLVELVIEKLSEDDRKQ